MTEDEEDVLARLRSVVPRSWFASNADEENNPVLTAVLAGPASVGGWANSLLKFTARQARLATAEDGFLDLYAYDFLRLRTRRAINETNDQFRIRIKAEILRPRVSRPAIQKLLLDLTGHEPVIFEPKRPADVGRYAAWSRTPGSGPSPKSIESSHYVVDTAAGASKGVNTRALGQVILPNGRSVPSYTSTASAQSYVQWNYRFAAGKKYRVRCMVQRLSGAGQRGQILSIVYNNGSAIVRAQFLANQVTSSGPFEASVEFTNEVEGTYANYFLGGTIDGEWAIWDASVTEVVNPATFPKITVSGPQNAAYGVVGRYGSLSLGKSAFIDVYRKLAGGIARVNGYNQKAGGYGAGLSRWSTLSDLRSGVSDDEILAAIAASKPAGVTVWVKIHG